jgi:hypothetical protein
MNGSVKVATPLATFSPSDATPGEYASETADNTPAMTIASKTMALAVSTSANPLRSCHNGRPSLPPVTATTPSPSDH